MISRSFQTVRRMREAWKWETYVRSQSFSSESAVKYLHVGRRKIQISPPLGEQDQSNALPQDQLRQSNPHPTELLHAVNSVSHPQICHNCRDIFDQFFKLRAHDLLKKGVISEVNENI